MGSSPGFIHVEIGDTLLQNQPFPRVFPTGRAVATERVSRPYASRWGGSCCERDLRPEDHQLLPTPSDFLPVSSQRSQPIDPSQAAGSASDAYVTEASLPRKLGDTHRQIQAFSRVLPRSFYLLCLSRLETILS